MSKQEVKVFMDEDRRLYIDHPDGNQYELLIFDGGGYYTALWPRTQEEIAESIRVQEEDKAKRLEKIKQQDAQLNAKKRWWRF